MGIEINKKEYLAFIQEYVDRDVVLLRDYIKQMKKSSSINWIPSLEEITRISDNLKQNIMLKESTINCSSPMKFLIDENSGQPVRLFKIDGKVQKIAMKRYQRDLERKIIGSNPLVS